MSFHALNLLPALLERLADSGYTEASAVQSEMYPPLRAGRDVLVAASTGSGKSLGYLIPLLERYVCDGACARGTVLVVLPTRELVEQLHVLLTRLKPLPGRCKVVAISGGSSINTQLLALRGGADIVLATPGRLLDVISHNGFDPACVGCLVLDEADRLLGEGFQEQMDELLGMIDAQQRVMVSASYTRKVRSRAGWLLKNPQWLDLTQQAPDICHRAIEVDEQRRSDLLIHLLQHDLALPALVFTADRRGAERLAGTLKQGGLASGVLHGRLSTAQRARVLRRLNEGQLQVLIATDIAARGIDVPGLPVVINHDLPRSVELYTHRMGRTARAGQRGEAISLVDVNAMNHLMLIEKRLELTIARERVAGFEPVNVLQTPPQRVDGNGGVKGRRMSKKDKLRAAAARAERQGKSGT